MQKTLQNRTIFCRDNLEILRGINNQTIDLIYLDPPFNKNKDFIAPVGSTAEGASFKDIFGTEDIKEEWLGLIADKYPVLHNYLQGVGEIGHKSNKYYLCYMAVRLIEIYRVLKNTGSLYFHCDSTMGHYIKIMLDCIFGEHNFRNEIVWHYYNKYSAGKKIFARNFDQLLMYSKSNTYTFNPIRIKRDKPVKQLARINVNGVLKNKKDENGNLIYRIVDDKKLDAVWTIPCLQPASKEMKGYPTQKPVTLLERIIKASSNEGDMVLDPFCGCATTCVASEKLGRQWIGIDISKKAFDLVRLRLGDEIELHDTLFYEGKIKFRNDIPDRTDTDIKPYKLNNKHYLFGLQEGKCNACKTRFDFRHFHIDHIYPQSKGGGDNIENLQLLCGSCNTIKGDRDMAYLMVRLKEIGAV